LAREIKPAPGCKLSAVNGGGTVRKSMPAAGLPSPDQLRRILSYDPATGILTWKVRLAQCARVGAEAGGVDEQGYRRLMIFGRKYKSHRVAYAIHYGEWPVGEIDHRNGVKDANWIANLRDVTHAENTRNAAMSCQNTSGRTGVGWHGRRQMWRAFIRHEFRLIHLGYFTDFTAACAAREAAERAHGFSPNHGRRPK